MGALSHNSEIVILQMEVWDIMKAMSLDYNPLPVVCVLHAMPFLGAPVKYSANFVRDVQKRIQSEQQPYRKEYVLNEYLNFYRGCRRAEFSGQQWDSVRLCEELFSRHRD